jgi:hypothetical protein
MSTRGTFGIHIHQQDKLMYNHSDSYPDGLGVDILEQVRKLVKKPGLLALKEIARKLEIVDGETKPTKEQRDLLKPYADFGVDDGRPDNWYCLTRQLQGDLARTLTAGINLGNNTFILDSLFCEWGYIVNLDSDKLEVYKGFQSKPHDYGRYGRKLPKGQDHRKGESVYYGCALLCEFDLNDLPTKAKFLKAIHDADKKRHPEDYEDEE